MVRGFRWPLVSPFLTLWGTFVLLTLVVQKFVSEKARLESEEQRPPQPSTMAAIPGSTAQPAQGPLFVRPEVAAPVLQWEQRIMPVEVQAPLVAPIISPVVVEVQAARME